MVRRDMFVAGLEALEPRLLLSVSPGLEEFDNADVIAVPSLGEVVCGGEIADPDGQRFHRFEASATGVLVIEMNAAEAGLDSFLQVFNEAGRKLKQNNNISRSNLDGRIRIRVKAGRTYVIRSSSKNETTGSFDLHITSTPKDDVGNSLDVCRQVRLNRRGNGSRGAKIQYADDVDVFEIVAQKTGLMQIAATPRGVAPIDECTLSLIQVDGQALMGEPQQAGPTLQFHVVAGQSYYLAATGSGFNEGAYRLVVKTDTDVNHPPTALVDSAVTTEDISIVTGDVLANDADPDGDVLAVDNYTQPSHGLVSSNGDGTFTYTPAADYHGPDSFTYTISDGHGGTATAAVSIVVEPVNDAPAALDDVVATVEDVPVVIGDVLANDVDPDGDVLAVDSFTQPSHGATTYKDDGTFTYTPAADYHGSDRFTYTISDGHGGTATAAVSIFVEPANDAPAALDDVVVTAEDVRVITGDVLSNDVDPDGDVLAVDSFTQAEHGDLAYNGDGVFTYTPAADYHGSDSFTYTISDGHGGTATAAVNIVVESANDAPAAMDDDVATAEDVPVITGDVLSNDVDPDGDVLVIDSFTQAEHGVVAYNGDGVFTYTPVADYHGSDSFTYTISDGHGGTATASVNVIVEPVNDIPAAMDDDVATVEDISVITGDVLSNDVDPDGDVLVVNSFTRPLHGAVVYNGDGTFTYTPAADYHGSDSFTYTIVDGHGGTATAMVDVVVEPANDAPAALDDVVVTVEDVPVLIGDVLANDVDPDGDALAIDSFTQPSHGAVAYSGDGAFTYTPAAGYHGSDSFTYTITDGLGGTATALVNVTVEANAEPVPGELAVVEVTDLVGGLQLTVLGVDGDDTIVLSQSSADLTLTVGGVSQVLEGDFIRIVVYGFAGADVIRTSSTVTADVQLFGGAGADSLFSGGSGPAVLDGGDDDDLLVSLGGVVDDLVGGSGLDSFWADDVDLIGDVSADEAAVDAVHAIEEFYQPFTDDPVSPDYITKVIAGQSIADPTPTDYATGYVDYADASLFGDGVDFDDVAQGQIGDCYFLASLAGVAQTDPEILRQMIAPLGDGTYAVRFYAFDGTAEFLRIDADLPVCGGSLAYAKLADDGAAWTPLLEKAYAYYRYGVNTYESLDRGGMITVYKQITNRATEEAFVFSLAGDALTDYLAGHLADGHAVGVQSSSSAGSPIVGSHAYAVVAAESGFVTVYNPWGFDGAAFDETPGDGLLTLTTDQFRSSFFTISVSLA